MFQELLPNLPYRRLALVGIYALVLGAAGFVAAINPAGSELYPHCTLYRWTGLNCPGCGCLRATHQLLRGNVSAAFALNPLYVLILPALLYPIASDFAVVLRNRPLPRVRIGSRGMKVFLALFLAFTILRNIPAYPFTLLAP